MAIKKVAVIGLGYVGLPTYVALHRTGKYEVVGYTRSQNKVDMINKGVSPIEDKDVEEYLEKNKVFATNKQEDLKGAQVFIICVPTPVKADYVPDYEPVILATKLVAPFIKKDTHYVLESTVNPGTCEEIVMAILEQETGLKAGKDFNIAHCPERINPGDPKWTIYNINRNIGSITQSQNKEIAAFYRTFITEGIVNEVNSLKVAEATKIIENTFRDINIAYVNELAQSFDVMGIDLHETIKASSNKQFAFMPHWPGAGVGGHCIAVDPYYLIRRASLDGFNHQFLKNAREINNGMPSYTVKRLLLGLNEVGLPLKGTRVALLGLSYKPDIGDIRESPALVIEEELKELGAEVIVYDPYVKRAEKDLIKVVGTAQAVLIATAHKEIKESLEKFLKKSTVKVVIDGRNCLNKEEVKKMGMIYKGIGR